MNEEVKEASSESSRSNSLKKALFIRLIAAFLFLNLLFFLPAWTLNYWQAWVYMFIILVPMSIMARYLYKNDPALLERRLRMKERQKTQRRIIALSFLFFLPAFIIPGIDVRSGWSNVPWGVVIIADVIVLFGYLLFALVLKTNSYASRIIEVEKGQGVISTGPYAIVRHPMYLDVLILYGFSPLALGSYWAMIPMVLLIVLIVARIRGEEKELSENLDGYKEYLMKTKYRLVPGIW